MATKLTGLSVSKGIATGVAKDASTNIGRFTGGEVMVTSMTTPENVVDMMKCAAVVTFEGGMLCHAAIVCRELKIPCVVRIDRIVGIAAGSMVTVDGDKGEVYVI